MTFTRVCTILLALSVLSHAAFAKGSGGHSSSSHSSSHSSKSSSSKPVHARGYTKKDGTYVAPYDRTLPAGSKGESNYSAAPPASPLGTTYHRSYHSGYLASGLAADTSVRVGKNGKIKRSTAAKNAFKREQPCPSSGRTSGSCPGYVIDHVNPLECGGADAPSNMQWQTVAEGKAKDKTERWCR